MSAGYLPDTVDTYISNLPWFASVVRLLVNLLFEGVKSADEDSGAGVDGSTSIFPSGTDMPKEPHSQDKLGRAPYSNPFIMILQG